MKLAILSDIHGNLPALQAVVADMAGREVDQVVHLGDALSGPLLPRETAGLLMAQSGWMHIRGNHERYLLEQPPAQHSASDAYAFAHLTPAIFDWLRQWPAQARMGEAGAQGSVCICHGTPHSDHHYLLETVTAQGHVRLATPAEIRERLAGEKAELVLYGHTHFARAITLAAETGSRGLTRQWLVNPGSVGRPAFDDAEPVPHSVNSGSSDARYAIAQRLEAGWQVSLLSVPYDAEPMARLAERNGRADWAHALRTGFTPSGSAMQNQAVSPG